jgi:hypothetical protein
LANHLVNTPTDVYQVIADVEQPTIPARWVIIRDSQHLDKSVVIKTLYKISKVVELERVHLDNPASKLETNWCRGHIGPGINSPGTPPDQEKLQTAKYV